MQAYPHHYNVQASSTIDSDVNINSDDLPTLQSAPPKQFGGAGDRWSPETLLVAAIADCFILTFKAIARASNFSWDSLSCDVEGVLDRADGVTQFVEFTLEAHLSINGQQDGAVELEDKANRLLNKAKKSCLITQSLKAQTHLSTRISTV